MKGRLFSGTVCKTHSIDVKYYTEIYTKKSYKLRAKYFVLYTNVAKIL